MTNPMSKYATPREVTELEADARAEANRVMTTEHTVNVMRSDWEALRAERDALAAVIEQAKWRLTHDEHAFDEGHVLDTMTILEASDASTTLREVRAKAAAEGRADIGRMLDAMPIKAGHSSREPELVLDQINLTKIRAFAAGLEDPAEWPKHAVSCDRSFGHTPHWWSEYVEGRDPLRVPYYCLGEEDR